MAEVSYSIADLSLHYVLCALILTLINDIGVHAIQVYHRTVLCISAIAARLNTLLTFDSEGAFGRELGAFHYDFARIFACCIVNDKSVGTADILELVFLSDRQWFVVLEPRDFFIGSIDLACEGGVLGNLLQSNAIQGRDERQVVICKS